MSDQNKSNEVVDTTKQYYDSSAADNFYFHVWGGEDIHVGLYDPPEISIRDASRQTVERMLNKLQTQLDSNKKVLDIGAGYGGAGRYMAKHYGCYVTCQNLSETQNDRDRQMNKEQGLDHLIDVEGGNFEDLPFADASYDVVWCQDSILHSANRKAVLKEAYRLLKPGGEFIFTDPMKGDDVSDDDPKLQPVLNRIHLPSMGSFSFYRQACKEIGFEEIEIEDLSKYLPMHYGRVAEEIRSRYDELKEKSDQQYLDRMLDGLKHWVEGGNSGTLAWGIMHFRKPAK
jgi:sarcosine/dimethylglycine N-methyltransferase